MDTYKVMFNEEDNEGVYAVSLVSDPAIGVQFITLSQQKEIQLATINEEQRILLGAVLIPNQPIYRNQDGHEFNIVFPAETIKQVQQNFSRQGYQNNSTIEHSGTQIEDVTFVETWIKEDEVHDKSTMYGFNEPVGTWFAAMKVNNEDIWNNYVKTGKVKGFSIDGVFDMEKVNLNSNYMSLESIVNAIKDGFASVKLSSETEQVEVTMSTMMLKDGVTVLEAESFEAGMPVFIVAENGDKVPAPIGEHELEDGRVLVITEEGMIAEIKEAVQAAASSDAAVDPNVQMSSDEMKSILTELAGEVDLVTLTKALKFLFNDRFSWEIQEQKRKTELQELIPAMATSMSVEVAKQIEAVRTELSSQIADVKTSQVEVKASTKAKPEVKEVSNSNVKMTRSQKIQNNLKNLN
jgi:hypothetical protein